MEKNLYTLEEAQLIGTKIIKNRSEELKKDLMNSTKSNLKKKNIFYV